MLKLIIDIFRHGFIFWLIWNYPKLVRYSNHPERYPYKVRYDFAMDMMRRCKAATNYEYDIKGIENIPTEDNIVYLPNHQAMLDPMFIQILPQKRFIIVSKKEAKHYPFVGRISRVIDSVFIDRKDMRASYIAIKEASERLAVPGTSLLIFLEGTRTKNPNHEMNEFKPGGLRPAYDNKSTICPVAMSGNFKILSTKWHKKRYHVDIEFLKPIPYEEYSMLSTSQLAKLVHDQIAEVVKNQNENI